MRKNLAFLITALHLMFGRGVVCAADGKNHSPSETVLLMMPGERHENLVGTDRCVRENYGLFECCPFVQADKDEADIIGVLFESREDVQKKFTYPVETIMDYVHATMHTYAMDGKVTCNVIEEHENEVLYEWFMHVGHKRSPVQHEIARSFLTETGFHTVRISRGTGEMKEKERAVNIALLKKAARVVPFEEAALHREGLSLVERLNVVDFGDAFEDWRLFITSAYGHYSFVPCYHLEKGELGEHLHLVMKRLVNGMSISPFFEMEKKEIKRGAKIRILNQSPTEVIYSYTYKDDGDYVVGVVRSFIEDQGYYSIAYETELPHKLKNEDVARVKVELEKLKICKGENTKYPHFIKIQHESCFH